MERGLRQQQPREAEREGSHVFRCKSSILDANRNRAGSRLNRSVMSSTPVEDDFAGLAASHDVEALLKFVDGEDVGEER